MVNKRSKGTSATIISDTSSESSIAVSEYFQVKKERSIQVPSSSIQVPSSIDLQTRKYPRPCGKSKKKQPEDGVGIFTKIARQRLRDNRKDSHPKDGKDLESITITKESVTDDAIDDGENNSHHQQSSWRDFQQELKKRRLFTNASIAQCIPEVIELSNLDFIKEQNQIYDDDNDSLMVDVTSFKRGGSIRTTSRKSHKRSLYSGGVPKDVPFGASEACTGGYAVGDEELSIICGEREGTLHRIIALLESDETDEIEKEERAQKRLAFVYLVFIVTGFGGLLFRYNVSSPN